MSSVLEIHNHVMISIPAGTIVLRDDRIKHTWEVGLAPFEIAKYPVTQQLYSSITQRNPSTFKGDNHPVENISWLDAVTFCNIISQKTGLQECYSIKDSEVTFDAKANGYRLPTEAEWEYACRAGTTGIRYGELDDIAWYKQNSGGSTQAVGTKAPNPWELYDMLGNVWEWCNDIYDEEVYGSYRILRGGGWCDEARGCMATNRRRSHPVSFKIDDLGFRLARNNH